MRRTELLQEIRKMRFEEAYGVWTEGSLSQEEAARILGVCSRTFRRYTDRYEGNGLEGLLDKRLPQASLCRAPVDQGGNRGNRGRTSAYKLIIHLCRSYGLWPVVHLGSPPH